MVKKFRRAAAGLEEQLPSDLRPPHVLKQTCDYLFDEVIGHAPSLAHVHHFVWDRTRAIRNDFSIQQVTKPEELRMAIECYERIARFHILSLHQLALPEKPYSKYDGQQEREQLDRTLLSLMQYYDDSRGRINHPNEAEFRAYCVIFQLQDPTPDLEDRVQTWPKPIIQDARVRRAVDLYMAACNVMDAQGPLKPRANHLIARQDWQRFWTLVASKEVSYLMACTAEIYFNLVRRTVLNALFRTFRMNSTMATPDWTVDLLRDILAFDDVDEVYTYCERFGFSFTERDDGQQHLDLTSVRGRTLPEPSAGMPKQMKSNLVEDKRSGRTLPAVINGLSVKQAQDKGLVVGNEHDYSMGDDIGVVDDGANGDQPHAEEDENSLFIPEVPKTSFTPAMTTSTAPSVRASGGQSIFNTGLSASSTFGKPSNNGIQASVFAPHQNQSTSGLSPAISANDKPLFQFGKPTNNLFDKPSASTSPFAPSGNDSRAKTFSFGKPTNNPFNPPPDPLQPSGSDTNFAKQPQATIPPPLFSFSPPAETGIKIDSTTEQSQPAKSPNLAVESRSPSPEQPKSSFTFENPTATPAPLPSSQTDIKPHSQTQPTSQVTSPTTTAKSQFSAPSNSGTAVKRSSFSTDTRPKKPSPLSNSITAAEESGGANNESSQAKLQPQSGEVNVPFTATKKAEARERKSAGEQFDAIVSRFVSDLCDDPDVGIFQQYIEYAIGKIAMDVFNKFTTERDNKQADDWRVFTLHHKYGRRWLDWFWRKRLARTGRERRERRQRRLQQRESQQREDGSLYEADSAGGSSGPGSAVDTQLVDSATQCTPNLTLNNPGATTFSKPLDVSRDIRGSLASKNMGHKRMKSASHVDDRGRITKPAPTSHPQTDASKRSSFLDLSLTNTLTGSNKDTTVSNYFRHKALGLNKIDQSIGIRGIKRRSDSLQLSPETSPPALRSSLRQAWSPDSITEKRLLKLPSSAPTKAVKPNEEDEALFARLRAARESLKLGMSPLDAETGQADALRQSASSQSSTDSPSMQKARIDARLRASQALSKRDGSASERSIPAYRLRESRFVPREHYGRAIERAKEVRESRSRETSRPESQAGHNSSNRTQQFNQNSESFRPQSERMHEGAFQTRGSSNLNDDLTGFNAGTKKVSSKEPSPPFGLNASNYVSFSNHTTQLPSENPFLQDSTPFAPNGFGAKSTFDSQTDETPVPGFQDHTINPSQISNSIANSFGNSGGFGKSAFQPVPQNLPFEPQQDSYMHSQPISLLSDDEDEDQGPIVFNSQVHANHKMNESAEEHFDNVSEDEEIGMKLQPNSYNGQEDSDAETGSEDDEIENLHPHFRAQAVEYSDDGELEEDVNGYEAESEDHEDHGVDGDVDEDESEIDGEEETGSEEDEEEDDEEEQDGFVPQLHWQQHQAYDDQGGRAPSKSPNPALQEVGNSAEEAIELSD